MVAMALGGFVLGRLCGGRMMLNLGGGMIALMGLGAARGGKACRRQHNRQQSKAATQPKGGAQNLDHGPIIGGSPGLRQGKTLCLGELGMLQKYDKD